MHKMLVLKLKELSGRTTEFILKNEDQRICFRSENGKWFEDEAWYISSFCHENKIELLYADFEIDTSSLKWRDTLYSF